MSDDETTDLGADETTVLSDEEHADVRADPVEEHAALGRLKQNLFRQTSNPVMLGRYRLDRRLAAGGMGVVYDAFNPELERRVAVKLLHARSGDNADHARARLLREAQALARLSHPNIVPVHDVGTCEAGESAGIGHEGVFVVMELIEGQRLDAWVRSQTRKPSEVLAIFVAAGRGLVAAHSAGIVHRDFKPSNVMVGADGRVRVLDFGLAAARGSAQSGGFPDDVQLTPSGLSTPLTMTGSIMGTPAYMAPEQHEGRPADAAANQFSFCVALFEALYGVRPFPQRTVEQLGRAKLAGEFAPPPKGRGVSNRVQRAILRGLAPRPEDRHPDLQALLRALGDKQIGLRLAVGGLGAALLGASAMWFAAPVEDACGRHESQAAALWTEQARADAKLAFAGSTRPYAAETWLAVETRVVARIETWSKLREDTCEAALVREETTTERMHRVDACADRHLARLGGLINLFGRADDKVVDGAIEAIDSLPDVSECESAPLDAEPQAPAESSETVAEAETAIAVSEALIRAANFEDAIVEVERARALAVQTGFAPVIARGLICAAELEADQGQHERARELLTEAYLEAERGRSALTAVEALIRRSFSATRLAQYDDAKSDLDLAQARIEGRNLAPRWRFDLLSARGGLHTAQGDFATARSTLQEALTLGTELYGADSLRVADTLNRLGAVEQDAGRLDASVAHYRVAHRTFVDTLGPGHPSVAMVENNLGNIALVQGELDVGLEHFERAHELWKRAYGPKHPRVADSLNNLANLLMDRGEIDRAYDAHKEALAIWKEAFGDEHPSIGISLLNISGVLLARGEAEPAREHGARAVALMTKVLGPDHPHLAYALVAEAEALEKLERHDEAKKQLTRAVEIFEATVEPDSKPLVDAKKLLEQLSAAL